MIHCQPEHKLFRTFDSWQILNILSVHTPHCYARSPNSIYSSATLIYPPKRTLEKRYRSGNTHFIIVIEYKRPSVRRLLQLISDVPMGILRIRMQRE